MQSFSQAQTSEAPPPYASVVPHPPDLAASAEGRGQKRQPCAYFLSGYCRNGMECPDYHGMDPDMEVHVYTVIVEIFGHGLIFVNFGSTKNTKIYSAHPHCMS